MALVLSELRAALIQVGADDDHATKAAEKVAGYQRAFNELKLEIAALRGDVQTGVERIAGEVKAANPWLGVVGAVLLLLIGSQGRSTGGPVCRFQSKARDCAARRPTCERSLRRQRATCAPIALNIH